MKTGKTLGLLGCLAVVSLALPAFAEEEGGELVEKVAVRNRLYSVAGRWEVGGNFGVSLLTKLTDHYNLNVSAAYNAADWVGFEFRGGYAISRHTSLAEQIQQDFFSNTSISRASDAADLWEMTANGVLGVRFQPIYGKINLVAELPVHFQLYLWAGGGAGLMRRESLVLCTQVVSSRECGEFLTENKVSPLVSLALGFRFFVTSGHSVKLEARSWSWLDSYFVNVDRAAANPNNPTAGGMQAPNAGVTSMVQIDLGYAFIF